MQTPIDAAVSYAKRLRRDQRVRFLQALAQDRAYRSAMEDILDGLVIEKRRAEPSRPLSEYLADRRRTKR